MRNQITHVCTALAVAALAVACDGRTSSVVNRRDQAGGKRGVNERVMLRGCVQPAAQGGGYALRRVMVLPPAEQPQGQDTVDSPLVPKGSWVRLEGSTDVNDELKKYVNNEVSITGDVVDSGQNTVGTAGRGGSAEARAPGNDASVANGNAPRVAVEKIRKTADTCPGQ